MAEQVHSMATPISDAQLAEVKRMVDRPEIDGVGDLITEKMIARIEASTHAIATKDSKIEQLQDALTKARLHENSMKNIALEFGKRDVEIERLRSALGYVKSCNIEEKPEGEGTEVPAQLDGWVKDLIRMVHASSDIATDALNMKVEG